MFSNYDVYEANLRIQEFHRQADKDRLVLEALGAHRRQANGSRMINLVVRTLARTLSSSGQALVNTAQRLEAHQVELQRMQAAEDCV